MRLVRLDPRRDASAPQSNNRLAAFKSSSLHIADRVRQALLTTLAISILATSGCQLVPGTRSADTTEWGSLRPLDGYDDTMESEDDPWASVGVEGRGDRPREQDPDPWYKNNVMSSKARAIERNMGID